MHYTCIACKNHMQVYLEKCKYRTKKYKCSDSESSDSDSESSDSDSDLDSDSDVFLQLITIISWNVIFEGAI